MKGKKAPGESLKTSICNMKESAVNIPISTTLQFVLSDSGTILQMNPAAREALGMADSFDFGPVTLRGHLLSLNPAWDSLLPDKLRGADQPIFLSWGDQNSHSAFGISLHLMEFGEQVIAALGPALAPHSELRHCSIGDIPIEPDALAQLFLRLQSTQSRLSSYLKTYPGVFFSQRPDFSLSYVGDRATKKLGRSPAELTRNSRDFTDLIFEKDRDFFLREVEKHASKKRTFTLTYRIKRPSDGAILYFMDIRTPQFSREGLLLGYEGVWLDITRQAIAEDRLSRSAWKENLVQITNGLIHDFSNIISGIYSISELYCAQLERSHPWHRGIDQIKKSSQQAQSLVRRIIDLNRELSGKRNFFNLESLIRDQFDLLKIVLPKCTQIETEFSGEELPIYVDDVQFRQMILNLAINSRDALGEKGKVTIRVRRVSTGQSVLEGTFGGSRLAETEGAEIEFGDSGCGISLAHQNKIFDPFFTTKEIHQGTGIGLYNAKLLVETLHGFIDVGSRPGEGAVFKIFLPLADFTENMADEDEAGREESLLANRPKCAVYSARDASNFPLVTLMQNNAWETITFVQAGRLRKYLREAVFLPDMVFLFYLGDDPHVTRLTRYLKKHYPGIRTVIQAIGCHPDELSEELKQSVYLFFDANIMSSSIFDRLQQCYE